jgi:hypothetical protein
LENYLLDLNIKCDSNIKRMESIEESKNQIQKVEDIGGIYELKL